jgi:hypothetical protein
MHQTIPISPKKAEHDESSSISYLCKKTNCSSRPGNVKLKIHGVIFLNDQEI